jgi:hypothetical protein
MTRMQVSGTLRANKGIPHDQEKEARDLKKRAVVIPKER